MKQLKEEGIIIGRADGITVNYFLDETCLATVKQCINIITTQDNKLRIKKEGFVVVFLQKISNKGTCKNTSFGEY